MSRSWLILPLLFLYLFDLGGVGFLGPDEPRYASVGREMAQSRDLVTPRLDGEAWFEKPPLLYWMTAAGRFIRLPDEWAARLPVALMSVAFLVFFYATLAGEFSRRVAATATAILATSAGWLAYSFLNLPDLPMSATLGAAMLIALFDTRKKQGYVAGALLGLSILAKAFVPLVLFAPMFLVARGKRLTMIAGCVLVAAPWHLLCWFRNGSAFWQEYFWKQQVDRFLTPSLQHVQPFWFYLPVLVAGLFPWIPLAGLLARGKTYNDERVRFLVGWLIFALVFFSVSKNKLPGYVLPLMPPLAIVLAFGVEKAGASAKWWLMASALMLVALPTIVRVLPEALLSGLGRAPVAFAAALPFVLVAGGVLWLAWKEHLELAVLTLALASFVGVLYLKESAFPVLEERVSVRGFWRKNESAVRGRCVENVRRDWVYGLNYYASRALPECGESNAASRITVHDGRLAIEPQR